jgi:hypothetical protein
MIPIYINGTGYAEDDLVTWEDAIEEGGFYYSRACYLGLPRPPAVLFDQPSPPYLLAMGRYHELFAAAEAKLVDQLAEAVPDERETRELALEAADQNLLLVLNRLRELADSVEPGLSVIVDADELDALADMLSAARTCL